LLGGRCIFMTKEYRKMITLVVSGKGDVEVEAPGHPRCEHHSGISVWHFLVTETEKKGLIDTIRNAGLTVQIGGSSVIDGKQGQKALLDG